jgi:ornithine cyclodeaminase/alanine dehydrogenase-like protein (mu-crystallin family)
MLVLIDLGSALSVRACPPPREPEQLLIFGSGAQAQAHATVFLSLFKTLHTCTFIVRQQTTRSEKLLSDLQAQFPKIKFISGSSTDTAFNLSQAVHNANIILTLVPTTTPLFNSVDVTSGTHLVLVGSYTPEMRDVDDELIKRGGVIMVDSKEACLQESGEIIRAGLGSEGLIELGALLGKEGDGLRSRISESGDVTIFKSVSPSNQLFITERLFLLFGSFLSQMMFVSCLPS